MKSRKKNDKQKATLPSSGKSVSKESQKVSGSAADKISVQKEDEDVVKIQLDPDVEAAMLELILGADIQNGIIGKVSQRLTSKKLKDMYCALESAGFKHSQIEKAMLHTVPVGGNLISALDWLCLNTPDGQLPEGFSQVLHNEEVKLRPQLRQEFMEIDQDLTSSVAAVEDIPGKESVKVPKGNVKDWILQYAAQESDEEEEQEVAGIDDTDDPNEKYLELVAKFEDLKTAAANAKQTEDSGQWKELTEKIKIMQNEIRHVSSLPGFDPNFKLPNFEKSNDGKDIIEAEGLGDCSLFEEKEPSKPINTTSIAKKLDLRCFAYTRQQWTGKSPKQFLIDWTRKHLPQSKITYDKVDLGGGRWQSRCKVSRKAKEGDLVVCPDIACDNLKDAEHLASTLALYHLCKGQNVYLLMPPVYRDVWLEWLKAEEADQKKTTEAENKPRDLFISRLMDKVNPTVDTSLAGNQSDRTEDAKESWEDWTSDKEDVVEEEEEAPVQNVSPKTSVKSFPAIDVLSIYKRNRESRIGKELLDQRRSLPVFQFKSKFLELFRSRNLIIVAGETGSGKSTQIPQFVLEEILNSEGSGCAQHIVCTQPRRISAVSLANRVSAELGERGPGSRDSLCGYQIRLKTKQCRTTRLMYCTTGIVLRQLQDDSQLSKLSCIIVDEVHERNIDTDFLMICLRHLSLIRSDLKVILMSATMDSRKFSEYFYSCPVIEIPGRTFPVSVYHIEDVIEKTGYQIEEDSFYSLSYDDIITEETTSIEVTGKAGESESVTATWSREDIYKIDRSGLDPERYALKTRNTLTRLNLDRVNLDLIVELLHCIDHPNGEFSKVGGAILVFLPGLSQIQLLYELLQSDSIFSNDRKYLVLALHSILSSDDQSAAFKIPPPGVRKIVLATNIAETGITIPDVVFVIDSGVEKEKRHLENCRLSQLQEVRISKANAHQRQGRAGRVQAGICFRLYTKRMYDDLSPYSVPEMRRLPLEELCLHIMKCRLGVPLDFLQQAIDPPNPLAVGRAMMVLREVGACELKEAALTPLGHHLAALPVDVRLGKMLIYAAMFGCLEPVAIIAASMADKSPFVAPLEKRDLANQSRMKFALHSSDHITIYNAFMGWKAAKQQSVMAERNFCDKYFLKRSSLIDIENISKDLINLVQSAGFNVSIADLLSKCSSSSKLSKSFRTASSASRLTDWSCNLSAGMSATLKAVITAGLYPNVGRVAFTPSPDPNSKKSNKICLVKTTQGTFPVHPASINRHLAANGWLMYREKVKYSQIYLHDTTLVDAFPILLFGGDIDVQHLQQLIAVDDWIKFKAPAKTGVIFKEIRKLIDQLLIRKLDNPKLSISDEPLIRILLELLIS